MELSRVETSIYYVNWAATCAASMMAYNLGPYFIPKTVMVRAAITVQHAPCKKKIIGITKA